MRQLSLTTDHIAKVHRQVEDQGPASGTIPQTDQGYAEWVSRLLGSHPAPERPTQLFAYGSLIWKPEIEHAREQIAVTRGWRRSFCFRTPRFRGTPDFPGLMMALDVGGDCEGVLLELPPDDLPAQFDRLFRREFSTDPPNSMPHWIEVETDEGTLPALAFVMNRASKLYVGGITRDEAADILARACGSWGSGAEYLLNTVSHLEAKGIHDEELWLLQEVVARRIDELHPVAE